MSSDRFYEEPDSTFNIDYISISSRSRSRNYSKYQKSSFKKKSNCVKGRSSSYSSKSSYIKNKYSDKKMRKKSTRGRRQTDSFSANDNISFKLYNNSRSRSAHSRKRTSLRHYSNSSSKSRSRHLSNASSKKSCQSKSVYNSSKSLSISCRYTRSNTGHFRSESIKSNTNSWYQTHKSKSRSVTTLSRISNSIKSNKLKFSQTYDSRSPCSIKYRRTLSRPYSRSRSRSNDSYISKSYSNRYTSLDFYKQSRLCLYKENKRSIKKFRDYYKSRSRSYNKSPSLRFHSRREQTHQSWYRYDYLNNKYSHESSYDRNNYNNYKNSNNQREKRMHRGSASTSSSYDYDIMIRYKKHRTQKRKYSFDKFKSGKRKHSASDSFDRSDKYRRKDYRTSTNYITNQNIADKVRKATKYAESFHYERRPSYRNYNDEYLDNYKERSFMSRNHSYYSPIYVPYKPHDYYELEHYSKRRRHSPSYNDYHNDNERLSNSWRHRTPYYKPRNKDKSGRKHQYSRDKARRKNRSSSVSTDNSTSSSDGRMSSNHTTKSEDIEIKQGVRNTKDGHLIYKPGDLLLDKYKIISTLGEGTFGKVVEALDSTRNGKRVAIKIIRNVAKYREAAELEVDVLEKLAEKDNKNSSLCVKLLSAFDFHGHACLSFDILGQSVFDFLKTNNYQPYTLSQIRHISYQLCHAVKFLHDNKLTHTDLKPENILFVNSNFDPIIKPGTAKEYKNIRQTDIRLIDFGSATFDHEHHTKIVSTRQYRALEVILELGWDHACDVWSIGCILFELYTGHTLFQTHSNIEHLAMIEKILGGIPSRMCKKSKKKKYFSSGHLDWDKESRDGRYVENNCFYLKMYISKTATSGDQDLFDLISQMLEFDPKRRIELKNAKEHSFHQDLLQQFN